MNFSKQDAKRHYGVHGYFTRQVWKEVQDYIINFTQPGDVVLDPFGGSGVTLIESIVTKRRGISIDINPLSEFILKTLITPVNLDALGEAYQKVTKNFLKLKPKTKKDIEKALKKYPLE